MNTKTDMIRTLDAVYAYVSDIMVSGENADRVCMARANMRSLAEMIRKLPDDEPEVKEDG